MSIRTAFMLFPPAVSYTGAIRAVVKAKKNGLLPRLDGSIACADCGKPATCYDHRNYLEPLKVEPVCNTCNLARGPGFPTLRETKLESVRHRCSVALRAQLDEEDE